MRSVDELNERHEEQRQKLAEQQARELHQQRVQFQKDCEHRAWFGVFRVAAALRFNITCAEVTPAQLHEAQERAAQYTMPRATR